MAETKLQIERRMDRLEEAILLMASYLSTEAGAEIDKILQRKKVDEKASESTGST